MGVIVIPSGAIIALVAALATLIIFTLESFAKDFNPISKNLFSAIRNKISFDKIISSGLWLISTYVLLGFVHVYPILLFLLCLVTLGWIKTVLWALKTSLEIGADIEIIMEVLFNTLTIVETKEDIDKDRSYEVARILLIQILSPTSEILYGAYGRAFLKRAHRLQRTQRGRQNLFNLLCEIIEKLPSDNSDHAFTLIKDVFLENELDSQLETRRM